MHLPRPLTIAAALALGATAICAEPRPWTLDLGHAHIGWEIDHMGLSRTVGRFNAFDGTFLIDEEDPSNSEIAVTINPLSIDSNHPGRDAHLRDADYLNARAFPTISFVSNKVEMFTPTTGKLHGDVTLLGVTAPISLDFKLVRDRTYPAFIPFYDEVRVIGFEATGSLERLDHGMDFIAFLDSPTGLVIDLDIHIDLVDCADVPDSNIPCHWGRVKGGGGGPNDG